MRTFPKHVGHNFSAADNRETASGFQWAPLMGGRAFDRAEWARESAANRKLDRAFSLHIGVERREVASTNPESKISAVPHVVTPQELDDEELAALNQQLNTQVRDTDERAHALADEEAADFDAQRTQAVARLEQLLAAVKSAEDLGMDLFKARNDVERELSARKSGQFGRAETLREHKASDTLRLARDEVSRELRARRAAKATKQAELKAMLAEAGFNI